MVKKIGQFRCFLKGGNTQKPKFWFFRVLDRGSICRNQNFSKIIDFLTQALYPKREKSKLRFLRIFPPWGIPWSGRYFWPKFNRSKTPSVKIWRLGLVGFDRLSTRSWTIINILRRCFGARWVDFRVTLAGSQIVRNGRF